MVYISVLACILVVGLTVGKVFISIPKLYKESKKAGMEYGMDLIFSIFFRVIGILVCWGIIIWITAKFDEAIDDLFMPAFIALMLSTLA